MAYAEPPNQRWSRDRLMAAAAAIGVQALIGIALITGLAVHLSNPVEEGLKLFVAEPPPLPPPRVIPAPRVAATRPKGRASPPNLRSRATEVAAPVPVIVVPLPPPPLITAPKPFVANDPTSGSAAIRGPGTGAGGIGDGFGSGGNGDRDSGGGRPETAPRFVRGRMSTSDLPEALFVSGFRGTVGVRYVVARDGRVPSCEVTRSSGNATVDAVTCRLIRERFRFRPSRDGAGRPVDSMIVENHSWEVEADTPEDG
jgi:protein TonB